jgi:hypothetical protein
LGIAGRVEILDAIVFIVFIASLVWASQGDPL